MRIVTSRGLDAQLLGGHDRHRGAVAAADVLAAGEDLDRAVAVDLHLRAHVLGREHVPVAVRDTDAALAPGFSAAHWPLAVSPAFLLRRSQPIAFAPRSYCARRTGLDSFFFRSSSGSMPSLSASSSIARLDAEGALRVAGGAQRRRGAGVREDVVLLGLEVRVVRVERARRARRCRRRRCDARRAVRRVVDGGERAVLLRPDLHGDERARRVAGATGAPACGRASA